jgi:outer membrane protein OmpA-like peptidoglycan-associated protein
MRRDADSRARAGIAAAIALTSILAAARSARAQEATIDVERFKPAVTTDGWVTAEGSGVRSPLDRFELGFLMNYSVNPLVTVTEAGDVSRQHVSGRLGMDLVASLTVFGPLSIGLGVPFFIAQTGDGSPSFAGLGDLRVVPKIRILDDKELFGLAISAELRAPTHVGDFAGGARNVVFAPRLIADHRFNGGLRIGANIGAMIREKTTFFNVDAASELIYAAGLGYRFGGEAGNLELGAEVSGGVGLAAAETGPEEIPLEGLLYVKYNPTPEIEITGGPGMGLIAGYGIPTFRVFAGIRYRPSSPDEDRDGIPDSDDKCPSLAEDFDGDQDSDGCPEQKEVDADVDGVPDAEDRCPKEKETINGFEDEDGCPDEGPARVIYKEGKIQIIENVQFGSGSARIDPRSYSILNQVALTLKANPDIKRIRVEGHTDETGQREQNIRLSKLRANAVRQYLIAKGVNPDRLGAEGYGPDRPIAEGRDPASRAKNRRVEFVIE